MQEFQKKMLQLNNPEIIKHNPNKSIKTVKPLVKENKMSKLKGQDIPGSRWYAVARRW